MKSILTQVLGWAKKVHLGFPVISYGKTQMTNPIKCQSRQSSILRGGEWRDTGVKGIDGGNPPR